MIIKKCTKAYLDKIATLRGTGKGPQKVLGDIIDAHIFTLLEPTAEPGVLKKCKTHKQRCEAGIDYLGVYDGRLKEIQKKKNEETNPKTKTIL